MKCNDERYDRDADAYIAARESQAPQRGPRDLEGIKAGLFYEIPLYAGREWTVPFPGDLSEGWAVASDLITEAAMGYHCEEIDEAELPAPLNNPTYAGLRIYRFDGPDVEGYFGVWHA